MATKKKAPVQLDLVGMAEDAKRQTESQTKNFDLKDITKLGEKLEQLRAESAARQAEVDTVNDAIRQIETTDLPEMMKNLGLKNFTLTSGAAVELFDIISASITDENRVEAHEWLREHDHGDIIKNTVTVTFGKGEDEDAEKLVKQLQDDRKNKLLRFGELNTKEAVHPSTLKAFVKGQLEKGEEFPGEKFKLYIGQAVKLTQPK